MDKIRRFAVAFLIVALCFSSAAYAEERSAKDYMDEGIRAAYNNMHLVYQAYYDENGELEEQPGGYVAVYQEWDKDWNLISRTYMDVNCEPVQLQGACIIWNVKFDEDGWSEWMKPEPNAENFCFTLGNVYLGEKAIGDKYTCSVEIEFKDVSGIENKDFWLRAQGAVDGSWGIRNVWNDGLVSLREPPEDKACKYTFSTEISENNVQANTFDVGFRCDYWGSGRFRIRNIEILKE